MRKIKLAGVAVLAGVMAMGLVACIGNKVKNKEQKPEQMTEQMSDGMKKDDKMDMKNGDSCGGTDMKDDKMGDGMDMKDGKMENGMMKTAAEGGHAEMDGEMKLVEKVNDGELASDFTLEDASGNSVKLSDLQGRKVYLKFWASWCPICLSGLEELNEMAKENKDFEIITVVAPGVNGEKNKEDFIKWFDSLGYDNVKVLFDESGEVVNEYGVRAYPTSAIIGTDGVLIGIRPGHMDKATIEETFRSVK